MKQSLQLKMGQQLAMTPQLQQAIRLLQLSTLELQGEIQEALESNPMLELVEDRGDGADASDSAGGVQEAPRDAAAERGDDGGDTGSAEAAEAAEAADAADNAARETAEMADSERTMEMEQQREIPEDLPVDSGWDDVYDPGYSAARSDEPQRDFTEYTSSGEGNLQDHLLEQMHLQSLGEGDRTIATVLIESIDDSGYLAQPLEQILDGINAERDAGLEPVELDELEAVLHLIQQFDPPGCGARGLVECMLLQLRAMPMDPVVQRACLLVEEHIDLLASHDYARLGRLTRLSEAQLAEAVALIRSLNPRPGAQIAGSQAQYVVPDVFVKKVKGVWLVELNPDIAPRLGISSLYAGMVKRADKSADNTFLRNHLQEARWFIKSLQSRNETLLRVATAIVERQRGFLEFGDEAMKPMVLRDIAEKLEMHESTISRVTTQKYMHTPRGIFEFKYYFSSHVSTADGGECSATAIRAMIRKLIAEESAQRPLSDSKIASTLVENGIKVARRTVAKYREAMAIPPSSERKRLM